MRFGEEELVWYRKRIVLSVGETVDSQDCFCFVRGGFVEALKQTTVEERDRLKQAKGCVGVSEIAFVAIQRCDVIVLPSLASEFAGNPSAPFIRGVHLLIQRCEKQILKDCLVIGAFLWVNIPEQCCHVVFIKECVRDKSLLLEKPDEDQPRYQADNARGIADSSIY